MDGLCPNSRSDGIGDVEGTAMLLRSRGNVDEVDGSFLSKGILYDPERDNFGGDKRGVS